LERQQQATREAMLADRIVTILSMEQLTVDQIRDEVSEDDRNMLNTTLAKLVNQRKVSCIVLPVRDSLGLWYKASLYYH
jgi:hypothetical protein